METIYQSLEYFSEGLIILERDPQKEFPYAIKLMNKAMRWMFGITSNEEMINLWNHCLPSNFPLWSKKDLVTNPWLINKKYSINT